jgi:hypothetical protein
MQIIGKVRKRLAAEILAEINRKARPIPPTLGGYD